MYLKIDNSKRFETGMQEYYYCAIDRIGIRWVSYLYAKSQKDAQQILKEKGLHLRQLWTEQGHTSRIAKLCKEPAAQQSLQEYKYSLVYKDEHQLCFGPQYKALLVYVILILLGAGMILFARNMAVKILGGIIAFWPIIAMFSVYFRIIRIRIAKSKLGQEISFERKLFFGLLGLYKEKHTLVKPEKVVLNYKYFVEVNAFSQAYFVELYCESELYFLSSSGYLQHEMELAQQVASFLDVPLIDNHSNPEIWPKLEFSHIGQTIINKHSAENRDHDTDTIKINLQTYCLTGRLTALPTIITIPNGKY